DTGIPVTEDTIRELTRGCSRDAKEWTPFKPDVIYLDTPSKVGEWSKSKHESLAHVNDVSAMFYLLWPSNVGHLMYDSIYPMWVTLVRFGYLKTPVKFFVYADDDLRISQVGWNHVSILDAVSNSTVTPMADMKEDSLYLFDRLIVGSRWMGHRNQQRHMGMPGSYSYENALYWYGQRILAGYGILDWDTALDPNTPIMIDDINKRCKGVITDNKRFSDEEGSMLKTLADESKDLFGCDITYMNWKDYAFEEQIRLFSDMNIYISAVGTGLTRCHLIKPGGVIVQLGEMDHTLPTRYQVSYRDVHMAIGSPHLNSVYYSRKLWNIFGRLVREGVVDAINRGINLARRGYPIPRPYGDGLSPTSQSYEDYCADSPDDCSSLVDALNGGARPGDPTRIRYHCEYCSWIDYFGIGPAWSETGCKDDDSSLVHCPINVHRWHSVILSSPERADNHIAFDKVCYDQKIPEMAEVRRKVLEGGRRQKAGSTGELTNDEGLALLLEVDSPDCPYAPPTQADLCVC
ncbi:hypothetical protein FOZ63_033974, partial [Perkinsus olseni]